MASRENDIRPGMLTKNERLMNKHFFQFNLQEEEKTLTKKVCSVSRETKKVKRSLLDLVQLSDSKWKQNNRIMMSPLLGSKCSPVTMSEQMALACYVVKLLNTQELVR